MGKPPKLIDTVKPGGPGLSAEEHTEIKKDRDAIAAKNLEMIQALNRYGVQVDAGLEAITQFRWFLQELGIITDDQRLAAEVMWENSFHQQLRFSMQQVRQAQLATPQQGLIIPGN